MQKLLRLLSRLTGKRKAPAAGAAPVSYRCVEHASGAPAALLVPPFASEAGHCRRVLLPEDMFGLGDRVGDACCSHVVLYEDDTLLGPAHASHDEIRLHGGGRYSHWNGALYFSTSDNSDPSGNGRRYRVEISAATYFRQRAEYAIEILRYYAGHLPGGPAALRGATVLEIGPGRDGGTVLGLAALGARVFAVERFQPCWDDGWHRPYLHALCDLMLREPWNADAAVFDGACAAQSLESPRIRILSTTLEELPVELCGQVDISLSHAALEHIYDPPRALRQLYLAHRPGGHGVHRVDFRDHRHFGRPLEFLLLDDDAFEAAAGVNKYEIGNRWRPAEMHRAFADAGFADVTCHPETTVDPAYLADFVPRLRRSGSRFHAYETDRLQVASARYQCSRSA